MMNGNDISTIFDNALFYIETLNCQCCNSDVDFYINNKEPRCVGCDNGLKVNYSDLLPVGLLAERAPIIRLASKLG